MKDVNITTLVGNLTADPVLRVTQKGDSVADFVVAQTRRRRVDGEWVDADTLFLSCVVWYQAAENLCASARKGTRVQVTGALRLKTWEKDGQKRSRIELDVTDVAVSLRSATARVEKTSKTDGFTPTDDGAPF